jgi:hypothetical protein
MSYNDDYPENKIINSNPKAGERVNQQEKVDVVLSKAITLGIFIFSGPFDNTTSTFSCWLTRSPALGLEYLTGKTEKEAEKVLKASHLEIGHISREYNDDYPENKIINSNPKAGERVNQQEKVDVCEAFNTFSASFSVLPVKSGISAYLSPSMPQAINPINYYFYSSAFIIKLDWVYRLGHAW